MSLFLGIAAVNALAPAHDSAPTTAMRFTLKKDDFSSELPVGDAPTAVPTSPGAEASASHSAQLPLQASLRMDDFPSAGSATACRLP